MTVIRTSKEFIYVCTQTLMNVVYSWSMCNSKLFSRFFSFVQIKTYILYKKKNASLLPSCVLSLVLSIAASIVRAYVCDGEKQIWIREKKWTNNDSKFYLRLTKTYIMIVSDEISNRISIRSFLIFSFEWIFHSLYTISYSIEIKGSEERTRPCSSGILSGVQWMNNYMSSSVYDNFE